MLAAKSQEHLGLIERRHRVDDDRQRSQLVKKARESSLCYPPASLT